MTPVIAPGVYVMSRDESSDLMIWIFCAIKSESPNLVRQYQGSFLLKVLPDGLGDLIFGENVGQHRGMEDLPPRILGDPMFLYVKKIQKAWFADFWSQVVRSRICNKSDFVWTRFVIILQKAGQLRLA